MTDEKTITLTVSQLGELIAVAVKMALAGRRGTDRPTLGGKMSQPDGGPAFPQSETQYALTPGHAVEIKHGGMSLRDYFAAAALTGLLANAWLRKEEKPRKVYMSCGIAAHQAYVYADAMLAERAKERT